MMINNQYNKGYDVNSLGNIVNNKYEFIRLFRGQQLIINWFVLGEAK